MLKTSLAALLCLLALTSPAAGGEIDLAGPDGPLAQELIDQEKATWVNYGRKDVAAWLRLPPTTSRTSMPMATWSGGTSIWAT